MRWSKRHERHKHTTEGFIAHRPVSYDGGTFHAPVKLRRTECGHVWLSSRGLPAPLRRDGRLVFALPGGFEIEG